MNANAIRTRTITCAAAAWLLLVLLGGCDDHRAADDHAGEEDHAAHAEEIDEHAGHDHGGEEGKIIAIPPAVRQNLGITFVTVEERPIRSTVRLPGQFELQPKARREYHVMLPGRVELLVDQYQQVEAGTALFHLESPQWQAMQNELVDAYNAMRRSHAEVKVAEATLQEKRGAIEFLEQRIAALAEASVRQVGLEAELAEKKNALPRLEAELESSRMSFESAHTRYEVMVGSAASVTGIPRAELAPGTDEHAHLGDTPPAWRSITRLTIEAEAPGIVDTIAATNLGWVETGGLILDTIDPAALRFHADALQTDINLFTNGQSALVVPPPGGSIQLQDTLEGTILCGFQAHPEQRTVPIYLVPDRLPRWAKAGVTAYLEVFTNGADHAMPAVPLAAVVRDGLDMVIFRRTRDADEVERVKAVLGADDGRWVELLDGAGVGDEIVLGGVYPLMLATSESGEIQEGGHFHSDGTFHESDDH